MLQEVSVEFCGRFAPLCLIQYFEDTNCTNSVPFSTKAQSTINQLKSTPKSPPQRPPHPHPPPLPTIQLGPDIQIKTRHPLALPSPSPSPSSRLLARIKINHVLHPDPTPLHHPVMAIKRPRVPQPGVPPRPRRQLCAVAAEGEEFWADGAGRGRAGRVGGFPLEDEVPGAFVDGVVDGD